MELNKILSLSEKSKRVITLRVEFSQIKFAMIPSLRLKYGVGGFGVEATVKKSNPGDYLPCGLTSPAKPFPLCSGIILI